MKLATWNVNSLKVRLPHLLAWLNAEQPDVVCLQETKLEDRNFPMDDLAAAGYGAVFSGQKTYNGVALLAKKEIGDVVCANPYFEDEQKRLVAGTIDGIRVICVYVPNGQSVGSDKYHYKLKWLSALAEWLTEEMKANPRLAVCGDFNIAPEDCDVYDPKAWAGQILVSDDERDAFRRLLACGLRDSFRLFRQPERTFSWWDYRMLGFQKNLGLRIDHILLSHLLAERCTAAGIDKNPRRLERPSDHAPAWSVISG